MEEIKALKEDGDLEQTEEFEGERDNSLFDDENEMLETEPINPLQPTNLDLRQ